MQLGKNLKIARQNSGYTQEEVSNILFVSQQIGKRKSALRV